MKPEEWIVGPGVGASSKTMWATLMGVKINWPSIPLDAQDFGRCWKLIYSVPGWAARVPEVADAYPMWRPIVDAWDELTALYEAEKFSEVGKKLFELHDACMIADGMVQVRKGLFVRPTTDST